MKLSEAIRLGSTLRPQAKGNLYVERRRYIFFGPTVRASCAWGAAYEAAGVKSKKVPSTGASKSHRGRSAQAGEMVEQYAQPPEWNKVIFHNQRCPVCKEQDQVQRIIAHLNDEHEWRRERIADWVETIELEVCPDAPSLTAGQTEWRQ